MKHLTAITCALLLSATAMAKPGMLLDFNHAGLVLKLDNGIQRSRYHWPYRDSLQFPARIDSLAQVFFPENKHFLWYIHCLYGETPGFSHLAGHTLRRRILKDTDIVPVVVEWGIWNPTYGANTRAALRCGTLLAPVVGRLAQHRRVSILSHSMGNKVAKNILAGLAPGSHLGRIFLVAPDLEFDYLSREAGRLAPICETLYCFYNPRDWVLAMSTRINRQKRLGKNPDFGGAVPNTVHFENVKSCSIWSRGHNYWLTCRHVRRLIRGELVVD